MQFHEAANIFPLDDEHLDELAEDIKEHGLQIPIEQMDGKIIDGRRRWMACEKAGVKPDIIQVSPDDPIAYVMSLNLHRRHLTPSQRSMVGARAKEHYERLAKERQRLSEGRGHKKGPETLPDLSRGDARDQAGKAVGVSGKMIDFASKVIEKGTPELVKAVDEGRMAVNTAAVLAHEPEEVQQKTLEGGRHNRKYKPASGGGRKRDDAEDGYCGSDEAFAMNIADIAVTQLARIKKSNPKREAAFQRVEDWISKARRK